MSALRAARGAVVALCSAFASIPPVGAADAYRVAERFEVGANVYVRALTIDPGKNALCADVLFVDPGSGGFDNTYSACTSAQAVPLGEYHHLAVSYGAGFVSLYIDGQIVNKTSASANFSVKEQLFFGNAIQGLLDDLRLYDHALTDAEIATLAQ